MLEQLRIAATFVLALTAGNATFFVTVRGKKFRVDLVLNGKANSPHLSAISQLVSAVFGAALSGVSTADVRVGANDWSVTVTPA